MDGGGKVVGYKDLQSVRDSLKHVLIRRKKDEVLKQLPERIDKNFFVPLTEEQSTIHDENYDIVVKLVAKWRRYKFLCEADQRRLMIALNNMRMAADNTYLVDKKTIHGPKIEELEVILRELVVESGEKAVIFSQWLRMTELVERILDRNGIGYVHLNGSVPAKKRKDLMSRFREDPSCMVFLSTDAGGVGLNLQSGSVVINMDIPWNPAVLEQRIGRVHRLGQRKTVRVINFITSSSIEERILDLLKFKKSLFAGALDKEGENVVMVGESQLKRFMQSVETVTNNLEKTDSARDKQKQAEADFDEKSAIMKEMIEEKGEAARAATAIKGDGRASSPISDMLSAGAQFLSNLSKIISDPESTNDLQLERQLSTFIKSDEKNGRMYLNIPLPERRVLNNLLSAFGDVISKTIISPK
jgi:superfamily II DNA/RNA helicase